MVYNARFWKFAVAGVLIAVVSSLVTSVAVLNFGGVLFQKESLTTTPQPQIVILNSTLDQEAVVSSIFTQVKDSVVHITATGETVGFFGVEKSESTGTGMVIDTSGIILTNQHVVENAKEVQVILSNGDEWKAEVIGTDLITDTAVIKISPSYKLKTVTLGDSNKIVPGQMAIAIGNPYVLENTITVGIVSGVNRTLSSNGYKIYGIIQTDAAINPGNSGGPLLNSKGEVIGITSAIFSVTGGFQGIGFAIPINTAKRVSEELIERGKVIRPWLGITGMDLTKDLAESLNLTISKGALIMEVIPDGPADKAGIRGTKSSPLEKDFVLGDIITNIGGGEIGNMDDLINVLFNRKVGEVVDVTYFREGKQYTVKVTLGERPD